jgi:hypothetical protein
VRYEQLVRLKKVPIMKSWYKYQQNNDNKSLIYLQIGDILISICKITCKIKNHT